ncbi:TPA: O-antigen ligase family protein, partial [Vibrio cholerae]
TSLLSLFLSMLFFFLFRKRKIKYRNYISMVLLFFIFMPAVSYGYVLLYKASFSQELNQYFWEETGKSLFTGRQEIWATIFDSISDNFIFGLGLGAELSKIGITVSSHNLYLMLIYQIGLVGLVFFIIYFLSMTKIMFDELYIYDDFASNLSISWVMAIMVHQGFEIFLFQNNLAASFLFWFILSIPFSKRKVI